MSEKDFLPHLPMEFNETNANAFDFGFNGTVAIATSHLVNFFYILNEKLSPAFSISPSNSNVTCLKFNPKNTTIVIGTEDGALYLFDYENRSYLGFILEKSETNKIVDIVWYGQMIIVLYQKKSLSCYSYTTSYQTKTQFNITMNWNVHLSVQYDKISIDPFTNARILLTSSTENNFQVTKIKGIQNIRDFILLNSRTPINDSQFSYHIPGYVYFLLDNELTLFDMKNRIVTPLFETQREGVRFMKIYQLINDHTRLFILTKSGTLIELKIKHPFDTEFVEEYTLQSSEIKIAAACPSIYDDSVMLWFVKPMGICTFDLESSTIRQVAMLQSSKVESVSSNSKLIVSGLSDGTVMIKDLYKHNKQFKYRVSNSPITFVNINEEGNQIVWMSTQEFGYVDLEKRLVTKNGSKPNVKRTIVSKKGAILVQRSSTALGIIMNKREFPLVLNQQISDFCFNEKECEPNLGCFMVLTAQGELHFFKYSEKGISSPFLRLRPFGAAGQAISVAWDGDLFATGTQLGTVSMMNIKTGVMKAFSPIQSPITSIKIVGNRVFGIGKSKLFSGPTDVQVSIFCVDSFDNCIPNDNSFPLICLFNGYSFFVSQNGFKNLAERSKSDPIPSINAFNEERLKKNMYTSPEARDIIQTLKGKPCLRAMIKSGVGDAFKASEIEAALSKFSENKKEIFKALLFVNDFEAAEDLMLESDEKSDDYLSNVSLGLAAMNLSNADEKQREKVITVAKKLISTGKFDDGCIMLRMAKADEEGFRLLVKNNSVQRSLKFARLMSNEKKKKEILFVIGSMRANEGMFADSALFFVSAGQGHAALFSMFSLGNIFDCFTVKKLLKEENILDEISEDKKLLLKPIDLAELESIIDTEFKEECTKLKLNM